MFKHILAVSDAEIVSRVSLCIQKSGYSFMCSALSGLMLGVAFVDPSLWWLFFSA